MIIHKPVLITEVQALPTTTPALVTEGYACSPFRFLTALFTNNLGAPYAGVNQAVRVYWWKTIPGTSLTGWFISRWQYFFSGNDLDVVGGSNNVNEITVPREAERIAFENTTETATPYVSLLGWTDRKETRPRTA